MSVRVALAIALGAFCVAASAEVVTVFGLPLGGKPAKSFSVCREVGTREAQPCWLEPPKRSQWGRAGDIVLPDSVLPKWAQFSTAELLIEPKGTIESLTVRQVTLCDFLGMRTSVGSRFGAPTREQSGRWRIFEWDRPDIFIQLSEIDGIDGCTASFRTPASVQQQRRHGEDQRAHDEARPRTP